MPLTSCEINFIKNSSNRCFTIDNPIAAQVPTFKKTDAKRYVPVITLSTLDNAKLLEKLKSGSKKTINTNKHEPEVTVE